MEQKQLDFSFHSEYHNESLYKNTYSLGSFFPVLIAGIVLFMLFTYTIRSSSLNPTLPTFSNLLYTFSSAPQISMEFQTIAVEIGDWGIFNWFADFVRFFLNILNFLVWLGKSLLNCLTYMFYFVRWLFLG